MKKRPSIGVAVIVVNEDGRVLLGKRRKVHGAGTWQFPGGHLEFNEAIESCARREVAEETGIRIANLRRGPYTNDIFDAEGKHYVTLFVVADYVSGKAQVKEPDKCETWQWFEWGRFPEPWFLPIRNLIQQGFRPQPSLPGMPAGQSQGRPIDGTGHGGAKISLGLLRRQMQALADRQKAENQQRFFQTGPGGYGEGDRFMGIKVPDLRRLAKTFGTLCQDDLCALLASPLHEERQVALFILVRQYAQARHAEQTRIYDLYMAHLDRINNWDLVDASAPYIVGPYLFERDRAPLHDLAGSPDLWRRRIGIMATFYFIRRHDFKDALALCETLLNDSQDLIHKAVGWMLREIGNRHPAVAEAFLRTRYRRMPRTMLRYAIEKFDEQKRQAYLKGAVSDG